MCSLTGVQTDTLKFASTPGNEAGPLLLFILAPDSLRRRCNIFIFHTLCEFCCNSCAWHGDVITEQQTGGIDCRSLSWPFVKSGFGTWFCKCHNSLLAAVNGSFSFNANLWMTELYTSHKYSSYTTMYQEHVSLFTYQLLHTKIIVCTILVI